MMSESVTSYIEALHLEVVRPDKFANPLVMPKYVPALFGA